MFKKLSLLSLLAFASSDAFAFGRFLAEVPTMLVICVNGFIAGRYSGPYLREVRERNKAISEQASKYEAIAEYAKDIADGKVSTEEVKLHHYEEKLGGSFQASRHLLINEVTEAEYRSVLRENKSFWIKEMAAIIHARAKIAAIKSEVNDVDRGHSFGQLDNMPLHATEKTEPSLLSMKDVYSSIDPTVPSFSRVFVSGNPERCYYSLKGNELGFCPEKI